MKKETQERRIAYDILKQVEQGTYANLALKEALNNKHDVKADFVTALVYTTLDHQITLDFYIKQYSEKRVPLPIRIILRMGIAQMLYMNVPQHSAIDESVSLCKSIGKKPVSGFVNALLRKVATDANDEKLSLPEGDSIEALSVRYSYPPYLVELFEKQWGTEQAIAMMSCEINESMCIHANELKCTIDELDLILHEEEYFFEKGEYCQEARYVSGFGDVAQHQLFQEGLFLIQSESAMLVDRVCNPQAGMHVLDACAAPGGKTNDMSQIMKQGEIVALDIHPHRVTLIEKNCKRLGIDFVKTQVQDATIFCDDFENAFDIVLLDAPCSGLGLLSGKPDIRYSKSIDDIFALQKLQRELMNSVSRYVKVGGVMVYATCTVTEIENSDNVKWFLEQNANFTLDDIQPYVPDSIQRERIKDGQLQLLPFLDGIEGFFMARFKRTI